MVDAEKLKSIFTLKGESIESVANAVGMDKSTLYSRMMNRGEDFSIASVTGICTFLKISQKDRKAILLPMKVHKCNIGLSDKRTS